MDAHGSNRKARYAKGLNDFEYCASLYIEHLTLDPNLISQTLHLQPDREHRAGDARRTPVGSPLAGTYPSGYWSAYLQAVDGEDLATFLHRVAEFLEPSASMLRAIVDDGGRIECFVGLFATGLCDSVIPYNLLERLGQLGIDLRMDFYCPSSSSD